ncbi:hypothetical protein [Mycolicibacterium mageritense]|uniref:hypothetical protein n=1 Tax=Mycolicibacterium mageritense TaxID=53462 RepID=UPI001E3BE5CE|nr:hypothetical protein [Mycolicibacterium mageritense]GJJ23486.1 hypothetical protein MTY414_71590 [Mycolicibacterium mageritense]
MKRKTSLTVLATASIAGAFLTAGTAHADDVLVGQDGVPYTYTTQRACLSDGPDTHLEQNDSFYAYFYCTQGDDGRWLLHNTDQP